MRVFISHCSQDKPVVRRMKERLAEHGLDVWLDEAEIRVGDSIPHAVGNALRDSDLLVLVYSAQAAGSPWVERELNVFVTAMIQAKKPILPCRLDETPMPALLTDIRYADFSASFEEGMESLLDGITLGEEAALNSRVQEVRRDLLAGFNTDELKYSLLHLLRGGEVFIGDRREMKYPSKLLDRLAALGVVDRDADRYELSYRVTELGRRALAAIADEVGDDGDAQRYPAFHHSWR